MSRDWVKDINDMHSHYGFHESIEKMGPDKLRDYLDFRIRFIGEEYEELKVASATCDDEEIVDALIDICVVAIGTLDVLGVDAHKAWDEVLRANMKKRVGVKDSRPNPHGLPDLVKPEDWNPPSHDGNHGRLKN